MPTTRRMIIAGVVTFVIGLVVLFPARAAVSWFAPGLALNGLQGTVWSGSAEHLQASNLYLRKLHWKLRPLSLLTASLGFDVSAEPPGGFLHAEVRLAAGNTVHMQDVEGAFPVRLIERAAGLSGLGGDTSMRLERVQIDNGVPVALSGTIAINGLVVPLISRDSLGGYSAEFFTQNDAIVAAIEDTDGVVDLAGSLRIAPDRSYAFLGQVAAKQETPASIAEQLAMLGSPNDRGQRELRLEGRF